MSDMMETTKQQDAWDKACLRVGNDNMLSIGTWVAAYVDERLADESAKAQPAEPRADGDVPEWFDYTWFTTDEAVLKCRAAIEAEFTRRVAEQTQRIIDSYGMTAKCFEDSRDKWKAFAENRLADCNELRQQLAASQAEVERLKRDASVAEDIATIANQHGQNGGSSCAISERDRQIYDEAHGFYNYQVRGWIDRVQKD